MRMARIKIHGRGAVYHCISRIVGGQFLLGQLEKEKLQFMLWQQADFTGLQVITHCVMSNLTKDYRWCGYAQAVAGHERARQGLASFHASADWASVGPAYRQVHDGHSWPSRVVGEGGVGR